MKGVAPPPASLLDTGIRPLAGELDACDARARNSPRSTSWALALEGAAGVFTRWESRVPLPITDRDRAGALYIVKFMLWSRGGATLYLAAPDEIVRDVSAALAPGGDMAFDAELMARAFERPFAVRACPIEELPAETESGAPIGGHRDGCRIGFDLGASDYKIAAVREGEPVFSAEYPWKPVIEPDPSYHYALLSAGLRHAAAHLPRVDAIGGSSAGIIVDNRIMVASLFRSVPPDRFEREVKPLFLRLQAEWGVPLAVANDGDVTALAGAMAWNRKGVLGIAMGSSEAAGYIDPQGRIRGWLNELAFAPVDARPDAPRDEWSGAAGVGAQYFSQQAVNRHLSAAGIALPADMPLPERLVQVQQLADEGDPRAASIFRTIGHNLGHTLPLYRRFYEFGDVMILGRVTSGRGGEILMETARAVLNELYEERGPPFYVRVPDEKSRRVGQAVAAASLPALGPKARNP